MLEKHHPTRPLAFVIIDQAPYQPYFNWLTESNQLVHILLPTPNDRKTLVSLLLFFYILFNKLERCGVKIRRDINNGKIKT